MKNSSRKIPTVWVVDLSTQEEIDSFNEKFITFTDGDIGQKLIKIIRKQMKELSIGEVHPDTYDTPSWPHKQAHLNGYRQHCIQLLKLLGEDN